MEQKQYAITYKLTVKANDITFLTKEAVDTIWAYSLEEALDLFKQHNEYGEIKQITQLGGN